jgi:hypothetical protein
MSIRKYIDLVEAEASPPQDPHPLHSGLAQLGWRKSPHGKDTWTHPEYPGHFVLGFADERHKQYLVHHHRGKYSHRLRTPQAAHDAAANRVTE